MAIQVHVDVGHGPDLKQDGLVEILRERFGDRYEVLAPGRLQVPDAIVKRSDSDGAAVQILQQRLRKRTRLRVYGLAPSIASRAASPLALARQMKATKPLVEEVVDFLESDERLRPV